MYGVNKMKDCLFCKIINGDIPCYKVYEDDTILAFLDVNPDSDGHTLIVPKTHYKDINDIPNDVLIHVYEVARKLSKLLQERLNCDGISLLQNNGSIQEVKHYHLHLKPYYSNNSSVKLVKDKTKIHDVESIYEKLK